MTGTPYVLSCDVANIQEDGSCSVPVWVPYPERVLAHLTLAEGTQVALAIVGCWTVGLCFRLYVRAGQNNRYGS